jgi:hypothetical protein
MRSSVGWELVLASGAGSSLVVRKEGALLSHIPVL